MAPPKSLYYCHFPIWYCSYIALLSLLSNVVDPAAGYPHADTAFDVWCFHCCLAPRQSLIYCHFPIRYCSYIALLSLLSNVVDPAAGYLHADTAFDVWCFHCCLAPRQSLIYCHFPIWYYLCISWHVQCYVCSCF